MFSTYFFFITIFYQVDDCFYYHKIIFVRISTIVSSMTQIYFTWLFSLRPTEKRSDRSQHWRRGSHFDSLSRLLQNLFSCNEFRAKLSHNWWVDSNSWAKKGNQWSLNIRKRFFLKFIVITEENHKKLMFFFREFGII